MRVCGVIAEYDPFHRGHAYHLAQARREAQADFVVCLMSGSFTQRGMPALLPAPARAEMALRGGADIVLQLPYAFSVREGEKFALGGVEILTRLENITHLSFGCETDNPALLQRAAALLESPDAGFENALREGLDAGLSHAAASGKALEKCLGPEAAAFALPNNALALCYLRALIRTGSGLIPVPVRRLGAYHGREAERLPSASALRGALLRGDWQTALDGVPEACRPPLQKAVAAGAVFRPEALDGMLRRLLLTATPEDLRRLPGVSEGLEQRMLQAAKTAKNREELLAAVKTRRYTLGRISRALCHLLMGVSRDGLPDHPACARILGFRKGAAPLLRIWQDGNFPLVTRPARAEDMTLDVRADELWQIGAGLPLGDTYRRGPVIID